MVSLSITISTRLIAPVSGFLHGYGARSGATFLQSPAQSGVVCIGTAAIADYNPARVFFPRFRNLPGSIGIHNRR